MEKIKSLLLGFIITILSTSSMVAQKKVDLIDFKGTELAIILDMKQDNSFSNYFLFQYENLDLSKFKSYSNITLLEFNKDMVRLNCDNEIVTFSLNSNLANISGKVYLGYGLSNRKGIFSIINFPNPKKIDDILLVNNLYGGGIECFSGGVGSSECSVTGGTLGGGGGCSVKCDPGYHACCDDTRNSCKCVANTKPPKAGSSYYRTIKVYPNPTNSVVKFIAEDQANYQITIFDVLGTIIIKDAKINTEINLGNQKIGIYSYVITDDNGFKQEGKIIKK